ncbi:MAG: ECF transporter S component [Clostridia bacterium]
MTRNQIIQKRAKQSELIRKMVIAGMLSAITALLTFTPFGMIPLPPPLPAATTVHVPVILAALVEGPWVGLVVGLVFGACSFIRAWETGIVGLTLFFRNPLVSVLPRLLVPLAAAGFYLLWKKLTKRNQLAKQNQLVDQLGATIAAVLGSVVNTVACLGMIMLIYGADLTALLNQMISTGGTEAAYLNHAGAWLVGVVGLPNGIGEAIVAALLVPMIKTAVEAIIKRGKPWDPKPPTGRDDAEESNQ